MENESEQKIIASKEGISEENEGKRRSRMKITNEDEEGSI